MVTTDLMDLGPAIQGLTALAQVPRLLFSHLPSTAIYILNTATHQPNMGMGMGIFNKIAHLPNTAMGIFNKVAHLPSIAMGIKIATAKVRPAMVMSRLCHHHLVVVMGTSNKY